MKRTIAITILCAAMLGCGEKVTDAFITTTVATATGLAFRYVPIDPDKRTTIANYVSAVGGKTRTFTGAETIEQVSAALAAEVPAEVMSQFPEIGTIIIPQVANYYQSAKGQFGAGTKAFISRMNAVATGLELGVANYITKK